MYFKAKRLSELALVPVLLLLSAVSLGADSLDAQPWQVNMTEGVTEVGKQIFDLHMYVFWVCVAIGVVVFGAMVYSMFAHRKSLGHKASQFHESTALEIAWTVVPFVILISMAVPATSTLLEMYNTDDADLDIVITGYQWKWKYEYLNADGENVTFFSNLRTPKSEIYNQEDKGEHYLLEVDEPLYLPVNKKTRFLVTANDVLHSWWVPALAVKRDAVPGFINEAWARPTQTGILRGQCAELCGRDHGYMPIVVNVVEQDEFDTWLAGKQKEAAEVRELMAKEFTLDELVARGKDVYGRYCVACHGANGEGGVGKAIAGSPYATGDVKDHLDIIVHGKPGTAMQAFGGQLSEVDLAAVTTYQRNAFGNNMGDLVQPVDVYQFKKGQ
ncbi:MAG TPA: cytochrome c oxidase subunit II [Spongiibacteraceae bacterium]|nr:cytochrome c oxidase subunit II [Spongiibacteraceae bacterium]HUH38347.1 cytochrome c oxidase subunit II [Spongiibacteraceae bacterium]